LSSNKRGIKYRQEGIIERITIPTFEPLFLQLQHFIDCILEGKVPYVTARDGYNALKLAIQIRDNALEHLVNMDRRKRLPTGLPISVINSIPASP
jgi:predicted dehydrogenase